MSKVEGPEMTQLRGLMALVAIAVVTASAARAQDWPSRPVHFIVPFPAGGSTDVAARVIANSLTRELGQQIVVENGRRHRRAICASRARGLRQIRAACAGAQHQAMTS
jgi:hypothetical protein